MAPDGWEPHALMALQLAGAVAAGGLIGLERTFHGRAAGFRTFALVAAGSCLPMIAASHPGFWLPPVDETRLPVDPTRVIQGIVTGIGFLGAGVIFRDGFSVRGLTTAACVWVVASIGMLVGVGLYLLAAVATVATLLVLALFRRIEERMPARTYVHVTVRYRRDDAPDDAGFRRTLAGFGMSVQEMSYRANGDEQFEFRVAVTTGRPERVAGLVEGLREDTRVQGFRVSPTRD